MANIKVDIFYSETIDGFPFELEIVVGSEEATIRIPSGGIIYRLSNKLGKNEAFDLYHKVSIMTHNEVLNQYFL